MLDIALLMANASQLKAVIDQGPGFGFYVPLVALITISLVLQISVGVLLIFLGMSWRPCLQACGHLLGGALTIGYPVSREPSELPRGGGGAPHFALRSRMCP
ncbi:Ninjurin-1 [Myotis davidii]|uniref:Ninjurin-1 n=2 Tax=Myotis davidii TaxID=225400 RepID=L5MIM4_MYODS|nr:Ninjurin-1 [Myotis davidii]